MKSHSKRILSLVFALLMLFQQVMFAAQTVDLFNPELGAKTVDLIPGQDDTNTVDLLTPSDEDSTKTVDLLNPEQPSATIEQQKPIIEKNENKTVDTITPRGDDIVPAEGKKSTTTIVVGGDEIEEGETNENSEISPEEIILPEENEKEEKKDASFEDEEHHENAGVLPWSTDLVKPWSIYRAPKTVYRPGEDLDLTELLVEIKTGRSGSLYNIEDLINDEFTTITRTRKSDGQKVRLDDKIYEDETMTIHMDGCQDLTIDFTVDENLKDEAKAFEAFQQNLIREEFRNGLDFSLYLIKKGEKENPVVAYSLDPHKLTPIGNGVDKKLKDGPLFDLKDINTWDRYDIETIGKVKAILERSAEIKGTENIRKKLITQLAIWNVTSNIIPKEIDATVSEPTEIAPELKPAEETKENPEEDKKDEPIEITEPTTQEEETENIEKENEKVEDTKDETVEIKTEEKVEEKAETEENKESEKIEEKAPVQSKVHKIVFNAKEIDVPYDDIELSDEEYELYKELTSLEAVELKSEDENLKIYEPITIEETENQYADLVTIGESDIDSIERVATEVTFDAVEYSFQNLYHTLETSSMLGFGQPRDFNVLLKATMKASRKIVKGDKFEVEILSKTLPILNGEEGRANDIQIDGKVVATAEYIAEEHKIVYTFVEDLDTDKVEIEQEFKQIKEEKAALLNMLEVSENLVLDAVRGAEGDENSEENPEELEISPEDDNAAIKLVLGNTPVQYSGNPFANKKFHLKTQMTAKAVPFWKIPEGWTFDVNIGPYLKPDPDNPLKPLYDPNDPSVKVATPSYDAKRHVITYTFTKDLNETKTFDIDQYLAFDTKSIGYRKEININITVSPKNYPVQSMPTIKVKGDDPGDVIESKFVVQDNTQSDKVEYPYMVSYVSKQSVRGNEVTWDIDVDTTPLKKEKLDYNNIALSLYIPQNQGLSDYRVFVDNKEGTFNANGDIVLSNTTISKNSIPDTLKIKVQAKASVERDAYSLGIRITPDTGYIQKLRAELEAKRNSLNATLGPLFTVISYLKDLNYSTKFDNGFNLLDTRITATGVPENGNERAEGYNDPLRTFYSYKTNDGNNPIGFKISETIDLKNIKSDIGSDVYRIKPDSLFNIKLNNQNPNVNIYVPINNGTYKPITLGNVNKDAFDNQINNLRLNNELLPGTIIEYDFAGKPENSQTEFSMGVKFNEREVFIEQFNAYKKISSEAVAKFININGSKDYDKYKIGIYKNKNDSIKSMIFKVIDTGENAYCINPQYPNPTEKSHKHRKVLVDEKTGVNDKNQIIKNSGLDQLNIALEKYGTNPPDGPKLVQFVKKLKKIFYYYDKYERENNLDIINDEYTKSRIRDARQAAIFDLVNGTGKEYLVNGHYNVGNLQVIEKETIQYYNILNRYINDSSYDLSEEQLKRVKITLYPITGSNYQNVITGEVDNPVSIAKVNEKGEPLSGATFQVIKNGVQIDSWISNGQAHEIYLEPGEYILREIKAPDGYKEIENVHFSVVKNVTINNIEVVRKDAGNGPDQIFDSQEKYYKNIIVIDSSNASKNINASTNGGVLSVKNKKVDKSIAVKKVDETDHDKTLPGAEFTLYRIVDGKRVLVESKLTGGDGIARFFGLQNGNYILVETKTPPQYSKIVDSIKIEVTDNGITTPGYINPIDNSTKQYIYKEGKVNTEAQSNGTVNHKAKIISLKNNTMVTRIYLNPLANNTTKRIKNNSYVKLETAGTDGTIESVKIYRFTNEQRDKYISHGDEPSLNLTNLNGFYNSSKGQNIYLFDPKTNTIDFSKTATSKIYAGTPLSGIDTPFSSDAGVIIDVTTKFTGTNGGSLKYTWAEYIDIKKPLYSVQGGSSFICEEDKGNNSTEVYNIVVANRKTTNKFVVKKVDKDSNSLKDAVFGLFRKGQNPNQEPYKKATSGIDGKAVFTDMQPGDYFVQEIQAPEGYVKIDSKINIKVDEELNITASKDDNNSLITIDEISEEEKVVPVQIDRIVDHHTWHNFINWRSELKSVDFNKNIVTTRLFLNPATDERGNGPDKQTSLTLESLQQNNKIKEIKVYKLSNYDKDGVHAETDLSSLLVNAENNSLYKSINYDSTNDPTNNEPTKATLTFGSKGENDRWYGASYVIDITTGFEKNSKTSLIKANWKSDGANENTYLEAELGFKIVDQLVQATVVNNKNTNFKIQKVDADDENKRLEGAEFTLYEFTSNEGTEPKVVKKVVTVKDGIAEFNDIKIGKYILKETKAPEGYSKINAELIVEIGENGKVNFSNIDDYKDIFSKTTTITKKEPRLTINRQDHNQALIQTDRYPAFMNLTAKVIGADEKSMTSRIYLNSLNTNEGFGPNRLTELQLSSLNSTGIKSTVYKVPLVNKSSIEEIDKYIQSNKPIANDLRNDSSNTLIKFNSAGDNRWYGSAYVIDVETTYDAINPAADATETKTRTLNYFWYNTDDNVSYIRKEVSSDVSVTKKLEDIKYEETCVLKVKNSKGTNFKIQKVDADNKNVHLKDAEFTLYDETVSKEIQKVVTDENGVAEFKGVGVGKYVVVETKAPTGYDKSDKTWTVEVVNENGKYKVILYGQQTRKIKGYRFKYTEPTSTVFTDWNHINYLNVNTLLSKSTDKSGFYLTVQFEKQYDYTDYRGNYLSYIGDLTLTFDQENFNIYEIQGNNNFSNLKSNPIKYVGFDCQRHFGDEIIEKNYYITIKNNFNVESGPLTSVRFDAKDIDWYNFISDEYLPKLVPVFETNNNSKKELNDSNGISIIAENKIIKRDVEFVKVNSEGIVLPGAKFKLWKKTNDEFNVVVKEGITSGNGGKILITDLEVGEYRLEETKAPSNYSKLNGTAIQFRITDDGKTQVYFKGDYVDINDINNKIVNYELGKGEFRLKKVDDENKELEKVKFTLTNQKSGEKIEKSTDKKGEIIFQGLEPGTYLLEETEALPGYKKSEYTWTVTVYNTGYTVVKANPVKHDEQTHKAEDVGKKLEVSYFEFKVKDKPDTVKTIYPNRNEFFEISYKLTPTEYGENGIKEGDYFTTQYSPYIKRQGTIETFIPDDIIIDQGLLAVASYDEESGTTKYTFTKLIEDLPKNVKFSITESLNVNREEVPNSTTKEFINTVAGKPKNFGNFKIHYGLYGPEGTEDPKYFQTQYFAKSSTVSISSFINSIDYEHSKIKFVSYLKFNNYSPRNVKLTLKNIEGAIIGKDRSEIKVYKVSEGTPSESFSSKYNTNKAINKNTLSVDEISYRYNYYMNYNLAELYIDDDGYTNNQLNSFYIIELRTDFDSINNFAKIEARADCYNQSLCTGAYVKTDSQIITKPSETSGEGGVVSPDLTVVNQKIKHPDIEFKKIDGKENTPLKDAEFTLFKAETKDGLPVKNNGNLSFKEFQREIVDKNGVKTKETYVVKSDKDGLFKFEKLEDGIYAVKETKAPKDYAMLLDYAFIFKVEGGKITEVDKAGNIVKVEGKDHVVVDMSLTPIQSNPIEIKNYKAEYPATGGVGTLPFAFIGMMIMMVGAYMFIRRRDALYE